MNLGNLLPCGPVYTQVPPAQTEIQYRSLDPLVYQPKPIPQGKTGSPTGQSPQPPHAVCSLKVPHSPGNPVPLLPSPPPHHAPPVSVKYATGRAVHGVLTVVASEMLGPKSTGALPVLCATAQNRVQMRILTGIRVLLTPNSQPKAPNSAQMSSSKVWPTNSPTPSRQSR